MNLYVKRSLLALAVPAVAGIVLVTIPSRGNASPAPGPLSAGFLDARNGIYLRVQLNSATGNYGAFTVSIPRVGLVWPAAPASAVASTRDVRLRYSGRGTAAPSARLDREFGVGFQQAGPTNRITLRLAGEVDPHHHTAAIEVWVNDREYHLTALGEPHTAGPVVTAYLTDVSNGDWAALYSITDSSMHQGKTQAEFVAAMKAAQGASTITGATVSGPTTYFTNSAGISYARTPIKVTYQSGGQTTTQAGTLLLINEAGAWKVFTVE